MDRRTLRLPVLLIVAACVGEETTRPREAQISPPSLLISDGTHSGGNPDFFFLPPMVPNPVGSPDYEASAFNAALTPTVSVCALDAASAAAVNAGTPCKAGGYTNGATLPGPTGEHYQYNWTVPNSAADVFYRVRVAVGSSELGFADIQTAANGSGLRNVNTGEFVPLVDGRTVPVKFRIERYALCEVPGTGPCATETVNLAGGGTVDVNIPGVVGNSGVEIPPQITGGNTTITVEPCDPNPANNTLNPSVTDLPVFGPCMRITADPPLPEGGLDVAATIFICDISPFTGGMTAEQRERITLHRFDAPNTFAALPHADGCEEQVGFSGSVKGFFANLARGEFRSAGRHLVAMVAPKPLYARAVMLDVGAGGLTEDFSDFQFALPSRLEIVEGDDQIAPPGTAPVAPKVIVKDLGGDAVAGARVRFGASLANCLADAGQVTLSDGLASRAWTLVEGPNTLYACGRGLAGDDNNGPRDDVVDPFQPIQAHFDGADPPGGPVPEPVEVGSVEFNATAFVEPVNEGLFGFGDDGWSAKEIGFEDTAPTGWYSLGFNAVGNGFTLNNGSPFGSPSGYCLATTTPWTLNTDLLVRKLFSTASVTAVKINVAIDNDVLEVWFNGTKLNASPFSHEGCPVPGNDAHDQVFLVNTVAGVNVLAIRARDRGTASFLNVRVIVAP